MSNWEQQVDLFLHGLANRFFFNKPREIYFNWHYITLADRLFDEKPDKVQKIYVDEVAFIISADEYWSLDEDECKNYEIWAKNGSVFIHFEDEDRNWYEIEVQK